MSYLHAWRKNATGVRLMLDDAEAISMFINTLKWMYYFHLLGHVSTKFANLLKFKNKVNRNIQMVMIEILLKSIKVIVLKKVMRSHCLRILL